METKTIITVIYWLLVAAFIIPVYLHGIQKIILQKDKIDLFTKLGYSVNFMRFIGIIEIIGASLLLFPQTRLYSIPIYAILLTGAIYSHLRIKDVVKDTIAPFIVGAHLAVLLTLTLWM